MKKVLVVDDEISVRKLVVATLRKEQVEVIQAMTGIDALRLSESELPDLIVMDVILPGKHLDGLRTSQTIKRNPITARCKILLISGVVNIDDQQLVESGADGFLCKPFNPIKLRNQIRKLLGKTTQAEDSSPE